MAGRGTSTRPRNEEEDEDEELTATAARFTAEIANREAELAKNTKALNKATAIRQEDLAAFNADAKNTLASIASMKSALTVRSKQNSFLQGANTDTARLAIVAVALGSAVQKKKVVLSVADEHLVSAFILEKLSFRLGSGMGGGGRFA